jgi:beta-glucanase (GH16 family)
MEGCKSQTGLIKIHVRILLRAGFEDRFLKEAAPIHLRMGVVNVMRNRIQYMVTGSLIIVLVSMFATQVGIASGQAPVPTNIPITPTALPTNRIISLPVRGSNSKEASARISAKNAYRDLGNLTNRSNKVAASVDTPASDPAGWNLTFSDEFNGTVLDTTKWSTEYGFNTDCVVTNPPPPGVTSYCNRSNNDEKEWYVDNSPTLQNGILKLVARKNDCSGANLPDRNYAPYSCENFPYTSGMISTHNKFSQLYGFFEVKMKVPKGQGFWPAFWLLPQLPPASSPAELYWPPEIDIMEYKGQEIKNVYMTNIYSGVYPDPGSKLNGWYNPGYDASVYTGPDFSAGFHTFAVDWEPDVIIWYVDGTEQARTTSYLPPGNVSPPDFKGDMHILLDLAVGGSFVNNLLPADSILPNSLDIDYVRVYKKATTGGTHSAFVPFIANPGP